MAVVLYKNGETTTVAPRSVQSHLDQGWSLQDPNRPPPGTPDDLQLPPGSNTQEYESAALERMGITEAVAPASEQPETAQEPSEVSQEEQEQATPTPKPKRKPGRPRKRKTE